MLSFIDKILIYIFCAITLVFTNNQDILVAYLLAGILILGICQLLSDFNMPYVEFALLLPLAVTIYFVPSIGHFMPIVMYHHLYHAFGKNRKQLLFFLLDVFFFIYILKDWNRDIKCLLFLVSVFAIVNGIKSQVLHQNTIDLRKLRDDSTETHLALSDKNRYLLKNLEEEIRIATLSERNRIARDIHDNVGHLISRSILQLGAIRAVNKDTATTLLLDQLKDTLDEAMNNIRESVHDLHKESFDLKAGAEKILEELQNYNVQFECDISTDTDKELKYTFLTILKEAVTNIVKHSNADSVYIEMRELDHYYQMLIEDNGKVDADILNRSSGIGISNMEERVKKMSGILTISTTKGFRIYISIPKKQGP